MIEVLQFIFSSFWIFCGCALLLCIIGKTLISCACGFRPWHKTTNHSNTWNTSEKTDTTPPAEVKHE